VPAIRPAPENGVGESGDNCDRNQRNWVCIVLSEVGQQWQQEEGLKPDKTLIHSIVINLSAPSWTKSRRGYLFPKPHIGR
jgi:hypothetical protein